MEGGRASASQPSLNFLVPSAFPPPTSMALLPYVNTSILNTEVSFHLQEKQASMGFTPFPRPRGSGGTPRLSPWNRWLVAILAAPAAQAGLIRAAQRLGWAWRDSVGDHHIQLSGRARTER